LALSFFAARMGDDTRDRGGHGMRPPSSPLGRALPQGELTVPKNTYCGPFASRKAIRDGARAARRAGRSGRGAIG